MFVLQDVAVRVRSTMHLVVGQADIHADITPVRLHPYVSELLSRAPLDLVSSSIRRVGNGFGSFSRKLTKY
jgi:hypothetical protein